MTTIEQDIRDAHALVWDVRGRIGHLWPTPGPGDSLLFALTELGEAVDAYLRSQPQYNRNRDKTLSVEDELADCAIMVLTALDEGILWWPHAANCVLHDDWHLAFAEMGYRLSCVIEWQAKGLGSDGLDLWRLESFRLLHHVSYSIDGSLTDAVRGRLERIERRMMGAT